MEPNPPERKLGKLGANRSSSCWVVSAQWGAMKSSSDGKLSLIVCTISDFSRQRARAC